MLTFTPVRAPPGTRSPVLPETSSPHQIVRYLRDEAKLTNREIGTAVGTTEHTVMRWARDPDVQPQARQLERLDDLRDIVTILTDTLPGEHTGRWLRARNRLLNRQRPLELIATDYPRVRRAAEIFVIGDPL